MTTPVKLKKMINYPTGRKSKLHPNGIPLKYAEKELLSRFKEMAGQPSVTRNKRALIAKYNPFHYSFGNVRPVWKSYETYAWNMGLLEDEDNQAIPQT